VIREELGRLMQWEERHRRLFARLAIVAALIVAVDLVCAALMCLWEADVRGSAIHGFGDALFFCTVQLLTVSSQMPNPVTTAGRFVDVALEIWAITAVTSVAGSFGAFFHAGDSG
jgi:hypothetical protein